MRILVIASLASCLALAASSCATNKPAAPVAARAAEGGEAGETEADEEHERVASSDRDKADADGVVRRGQPLSASEAVPVSAAIAKAAELDGKKVKLAGTVAQVCAKRGCWFVVQGEKPADAIRISTRAKDIYVPHDAVGMKAVVEGTLTHAGDGSLTVDVSGLEMTRG